MPAQQGIVTFNFEYLFYLLYQLLTGAWLPRATSSAQTPPYTLADYLILAQIWWERLALVSFLLTGIMVVGIAYMVVKISRLRRYQDTVLFAPLPPRSAAGTQAPLLTATPEWRALRDWVLTDDPALWRDALLRATSLFVEVLRARGVPGETPQERVAALTESPLPEAAAAQAAFAFAQQAAQSGTDVVLTRPAVLQAFDAYERFFDAIEAQADEVGAAVRSLVEHSGA